MTSGTRCLRGPHFARAHPMFNKMGFADLLSGRDSVRQLDMVLSVVLNHIPGMAVMHEARGGLHEPKTVLTRGPPSYGSFELELSNLGGGRVATSENFSIQF